jgi:hypothetical protein
LTPLREINLTYVGFKNIVRRAKAVLPESFRGIMINLNCRNDASASLPCSSIQATGAREYADAINQVFLPSCV